MDLPDLGARAASHALPADHARIARGLRRGELPDESRTTRVAFSYRYIALSESGTTFIAAMTRARHAAMIEEWARLIEAMLHAPGATHRQVRGSH